MARRQQAADRAERPAMRSPGHPYPPRYVEQAFWRRIAEGMGSEDAAVAVGVSAPVGSRWFRNGGGMSPINLAAPSGRYLSLVEREEVAILMAQDHGVREIARRMGRHPSTISRELRRNAATRGGKMEYRASVAQWKAQTDAQHPLDSAVPAVPREGRCAGQGMAPAGVRSGRCCPSWSCEAVPGPVRGWRDHGIT